MRDVGLGGVENATALIMFTGETSMFLARLASFLLLTRISFLFHRVESMPLLTTNPTLFFSRFLPTGQAGAMAFENFYYNADKFSSEKGIIT